MGCVAPTTPDCPHAAETERLRRRLRGAQKRLREARAELAARPPAAGDEGPLSPEEIRHLHAQFRPTPPGEKCTQCGQVHPGACQTCGGLHARACPRVRAVEYEVHGDRVTIRRVDYWPPGRWDSEGIIWPEELPPLPGDG